MKSLKQVWAAAQRNPLKDIKQEPQRSRQATIAVPIQIERISTVIVEILSKLYRNLNCRLWLL